MKILLTAFLGSVLSLLVFQSARAKEINPHEGKYFCKPANRVGLALSDKYDQYSKNWTEQSFHVEDNSLLFSLKTEDGYESAYFVSIKPKGIGKWESCDALGHGNLNLVNDIGGSLICRYKYSSFYRFDIRALRYETYVGGGYSSGVFTTERNPVYVEIGTCTKIDD